jgi:hypothetical protein
MPKRIAIKHVREKFEEEGYELLSKKYVDAHTKLEYICPNGHKHSITWANWSQGKRCKYCQYETLSKKYRLDLKIIKRFFEREKYELLTKKYTNAHQKLDYICPKGHKCSISWNSFRQGQRCYFCHGNVKPTIEFIKSEFVKEGYVLLTEKYINCKQKLDYICSKGHKHSIRWNDWQQDIRCPTCYRENNYGSNHPSWKGGVSFEPYPPEFNNKLKKFILERDNYQCQNSDCWKTMSDDITIHHIDYNKENCDPSNLITLCRSCNTRANKDREYWIKFYQKIMNKKYGYNYGKQKAFFR